MKSVKAIMRGAVVFLVAANMAGATDYTWNYAGNDVWNRAAGQRWSPNTGYPGQAAGDTASFTSAVGRVVTFNVSPANVVDAFTVSGPGTWQWAGNTYTLLIGAGNLNYSGSNTLAGVSLFEAILDGSGGVRMNSGALRMGYRSIVGGVSTHNNPFSGGVEVNGGTLLSGHSGWEGGSGKELGTGTFTIGSAAPGNTDATLLLAGNALYTNSVIIRSGNAGVARLGRWNLNIYGSTRLSGSITLQKGLTIENGDDLIAQPSVNPWDAPVRERYPLQIEGSISGMHPITKEGVGVVYFMGMNSSTGTTTIRGGTTYMRGVDNSNVGNFTVEYGTMLVQNSTSLGNAGNTVTLGAPGTFGAFGVGNTVANTVVPLPRAITLAGNGGIITSRGTYPVLQLDGVITGSGRLILSPGSPNHLRTSLHGDNDYTGGTIATDGYMDIANTAAHNRTVYGTGDIWILRNGYLPVYGANNIGAGAKVRVDWPATVAVTLDYVPNITADSDGVLAFSSPTWLITGNTINNRLADGANPLGNGKMWLGCGVGQGCTFTGSSLAAIVVNDGTHTYRIGSASYDSIARTALNTATTAGALKDLNGNPHNVLVANQTVEFYDDNTFTGTLTVNSRGTCKGFLPDATGNPFGADSGSVALKGGARLNVVNSYHGTRSVDKNIFAFEGAAGPLTIDGDNGTPSWTTTFNVAALARVNRATLSIDAYRKTLGDVERMTVGGGVPSIDGMVAPYLWNSVDAVFLDYGANGFTNAPPSLTTLAGCTASDIVYLTSGSGVVPAGGASVYAIKSALTLSGGTLTNHSGGMILTGNGLTHTAPLDFGANEAVVYVTQANTLAGRLTGAGGLTKCGVGQLTLTADNTGSLTGGITVNEGTLYVNHWTQLGGTANVITLNGGTLHGNDRSKAFTNAIVLGPLGGSLYAGSFYGAISGPGTLTSAYHDHRIMSPNNTYSGGTVINASTKVEAVSSLSTGGTVTVNSGALMLFGAGNVGNGHRLIIASAAGGVYFFNTTPVVGSIEGNGTIALGTSTITSTLRVGGNNRSTDYFGILTEGENFSATPRTLVYGKLIKEGTGTLTLWGECRYRGGTIVSNGTLCVNNWLNPAGSVTVRPGATLDGIGTVGVVNNQGGTVKGNLVTAGLNWDGDAIMQVTLDGADAGEYDALTVNGPVTLGGALSLALNFVPAMGQEFMIIANDGTDAVTGQFESGILNIPYNGTVIRFQISYNGGDGNDVVLVRVPLGTMIVVR